jgi:hypothetical protein
MAIFDEIGRKITQTSQVAVQKTKDITEVARLNGEISEEERKINNAYNQIGQVYVQLHKNDAEDSLAELVAVVNNANDRIAVLRRQVQDIKGIKRCPSCSAEIPANATFCSNCGAPAPKEQPVSALDVVVCKNCGNTVNKGMKFCTSCGCQIIFDQPQPKPAPAICKNCGAPLEENAEFCSECGCKTSE